MILSCPSCATRYLVNPAKLRPAGRTVRCARCGEQWFADAPPPDEAEAPDQVLPADDITAPEAPPETNQETPQEDRPARDRTVVRPPRHAPEPTNLPALQRPQPKLLEAAGWAGLVAFIGLIITGGWLFRTDIVTAWPSAERLYDTLGVETAVKAKAPKLAPLEDRLKFRDLHPTQQFVDGVLTLIIEGRIENIGPVAETVPPVEVVLLDDRQLDLLTWLFEAPQPRLAPGEALSFETRLENPPPEAQDIRVNFAAGSGPEKR